MASPLSSAARRVPFTVFVTAAAATAEVRFTTRAAWVGTVGDGAGLLAGAKDREHEGDAAKEGTADDVEGRLIDVGSASRYSSVSRDPSTTMSLSVRFVPPSSDPHFITYFAWSK